MKKKEIFVIAFVVILILAAVGVIILMTMGTNIVEKDPRSIALSLSDISNIPSDLFFNLSLSVATYKTGNYYWNNETERQEAINQGFTNGYYDYFVYQDSNMEHIKTIGSSVALFNSSAQKIISDDIKAYTEKYNCVSFNLSTVGENSFGCYQIINTSSMEMSYYIVFFYKKNVATRIWVGETGTTDLSSEAVKYANIIAGRIS